MSLDEVKRSTSASQFVLWMEYLEWDINAFDKTAYYLAQIATEVRRSFVKNPTSVKVEDFIMKFKLKGDKTEIPPDVQIRTQKAKQFFFGLTGLLGSAGKKKRK
jgi:hypothetical protein